MDTKIPYNYTIRVIAIHILQFNLKFRLMEHFIEKKLQETRFEKTAFKVRFNTNSQSIILQVALTECSK